MSNRGRRHADEAETFGEIDHAAAHTVVVDVNGDLFGFEGHGVAGSVAIGPVGVLRGQLLQPPGGLDCAPAVCRLVVQREAAPADMDGGRVVAEAGYVAADLRQVARSLRWVGLRLGGRPEDIGPDAGSGVRPAAQQSRLSKRTRPEPLPGTRRPLDVAGW